MATDAEAFDSIPPGQSRPDSFSVLLIQQQAKQHSERMIEARELRKTLGARLTILETGQSKIATDVVELKTRLPGKVMQVSGLGFAASVLVLLILLLATARGIPTAQAVQGTQALVGHLAPAPQEGQHDPPP